MSPGTYECRVLSIMQVLRYAAMAALMAGTIGSEERHRGVIVESLTNKYAAARAGLQEGDIVLRWTRGEATGRIQSPFDLVFIELEQLPRGAVTLEGERHGSPQRWPIGPDDWGLQTRPVLTGALSGAYTEARTLEIAGQPLKAAIRWRAAAADAQGYDALWLLFRAADTLSRARQWTEADEAYEAALANPASDASPIPALLLRSWGKSFKRRSDWTHTGQYLAQALAAARRSHENLTAAAILEDLGLVAENQGNLVKAEEDHHQALTIRQKYAPDSLSVASSLNALGNVARQRGDLARAEEYCRKAVLAQQRIAPESLAIVDTLNNLGYIAWKRDDYNHAEEYSRAAQRIAEDVAPASLEAASSLHNLGLVFWRRGDLETAEKYVVAGRDIRAKVAPGGLEVARSLGILGNIGLDRGDLANAEKCHREALTIQESLAPGSLDTASTLNNLGIVLYERGDLASAEDSHRAALSIRRKIAPGSLDVAASLNNLGNVLAFAGDPAKADEYQHEALTIQQRIAPDGLQAGFSLANLALSARDRGDLASAGEFARLAMRIFQKLAPGSVHHAKSLDMLGTIATNRGDLPRAEEFHRAAMQMFEALAPGTLDVAQALFALGNVALKGGQIDTAEKYYSAALAIREKLAPGSIEQADTLAALGRIMQNRHNLDRASALFAQSLDALEHQMSEVGGSGIVRARFRSEHAGYYRDYVQVLLDQGQPNAAFHVVERSRARSLLEMLAERDLVFASDLPADIRDARRRNAAAYDSTQSELGSLIPGRDASKIEKLQHRLRELEREREGITERVRRASPRLATLQYPVPLDLEKTRRVLDPGTALLSYVVADKETILFAILPYGTEPGLSVFTIPVSGAALRTQVLQLRKVLEGPPDTRAATAARLKHLYELLVRPAESVVDSSTRLLIVPDGPLHLIPFGALRRSSGQYLVEWKPVHTALSATVYSELKEKRKDQAAKQVVLAAFGDPVYPAAGKTGATRSFDTDLRWETHRGLTLSRLLFSGPEVETIAGVFPGHSRKYLRAEASEERAKSSGTSIRYLHFATHGLFDERFPLNSGLALTIPASVQPGRDNGLLQAWEVFEQLRIDADLVTLSGCNTALGQELEGEGLIGLTRAFEYAGAHSVLASLWSVDDRSTSLLMERFYKELRDGKAKDDALRSAQISLLKAPATARPRYWAAFVLNGDYR